MLGMTGAAVRNWESGKGTPYRKTFLKISQLTKKPVSFFTGDKRSDMLSVADLAEDDRRYSATGSARQDEAVNPFDVDVADPEMVEGIADAILAVRSGRQKLKAIAIELRDLDNSMLALEARLKATIGAEK